jgi:hypothetical protein
MKIYHLDIKDASDPRFDMHLFYTHDDDSKTYKNLADDYVEAYDQVVENSDDWTIEDIFIKLDSFGWKPFNVETARVRF